MKYKFFLIVLIISLYLFIPLTSYGVGLEIYTLDVGQGDSSLIVTPAEKRILIDGGRDAAVIEQLDKVIPFWDRNIDLIMLSHPDADHLAGLIDVIHYYKVKEVALTLAPEDSKLYDAFISEIKRYRIKSTYFIQGSIVDSGDGVTIRGLWPTGEVIASPTKNENSQVGLITYSVFTGLFTGDIDTNVAEQLEANNELGDINYLKVPHHGSKYGLTKEQLIKLSPEISTISVGEDNNYGHPSASTLQNLQSIGSMIKRTDRNGLIAVEVNISGINIKSE